MGYLQPRVTDLAPCTLRLLCAVLDFLAGKFIPTVPCALFRGFSLSQHCMNLGCGQQSRTAAFIAMTPGSRETFRGAPTRCSYELIWAGQSAKKPMCWVFFLLHPCCVRVTLYFFNWGLGKSEGSGSKTYILLTACLGPCRYEASLFAGQPGA